MIVKSFLTCLYYLMDIMMWLPKVVGMMPRQVKFFGKKCLGYSILVKCCQTYV